MERFAALLASVNPSTSSAPHQPKEAKLYSGLKAWLPVGSLFSSNMDYDEDDEVDEL